MTYDGTAMGQPNIGNGVSSGTAPAWADWGSAPGPGGFQELDLGVQATLLRKGNYNYFDKAIPPAESLGGETLPASLYLAAKPAWFGNLAWPAVNPLAPGTPLSANEIYAKIPAGYRYLNGTNPPGASSSPPILTPTPEPEAIPTPAPEAIPTPAPEAIPTPAPDTITGGTWYDSVAPESTDGTDDSTADTAVGAQIIPAQSGNCTKLRVRFDTVWRTGITKIALFDASGQVLASGVANHSRSDSGRWLEVSLGSSVQVSAGTPYIILEVPSRNNSTKPRFRANQLGGKVDFTKGDYATFPQVSSSQYNTTHLYCVGMLISN